MGFVATQIVRKLGIEMGRSIPVDLGVVTFKSRTAAREFFQAMLHRYAVGDRVSSEDQTLLSELLKRHPDSLQKIGVGIDHFEVLGADFDTQCFHIFRTDGTFEDFSLHTCVDQR